MTTPAWIAANNRSPEGLEVIRRRNLARNRALQELRRRHPEEFAELLEQEAAKLPPARASRVKTGDDEIREMYGV